MRKRYWPIGLVMFAACSSPSPTRPRDPVAVPSTPQFSIQFVLANPASLSVSEPALCPGAWSTCARGSQPQGARTTGTITTKNYVLPAGTYRLTGVLQPTTSIGASVDVRAASIATGDGGGGIAREGPVLGAVAHTGDAPFVTSMVSKTCGATFSNASGELEWSLIVRVVATSQSVEQLC